MKQRAVLTLLRQAKRVRAVIALPGVRTAASIRRALILAMLVFLAGCARSPVPPLRVATHPWPGYESLHLAQSLGYFNASQVRLVELANASQTYEALSHGTVDAAAQTLDEVLALMQHGADLRVVLVMDVSDGADVVLARPGIATLQDLRGKRVGVENTTTGAVLFDAMLTAAGLTAGDLQLVPLSMNEHVAAYRSGQVDALVTYDPPRSILLRGGAHVLFDSSRIPGRIVDVLVVRADALADHRQQIAALVAAHFKALHYLRQRPQDAARRLGPFLGVTVDQVPSQFVGMNLPGLGENRALLAGTAPGLTLHAAELGELMLRHDLLESKVTTDHLADPAFLPADAK